MIARTILLTGTGTVGRELLGRLLRDGASRVAILMRDRGRRSAVARAEALYEALHLSRDERDRVEVLRGDITAPAFGLDRDTQARLVERLDAIVHSAAVTSLTADRALCDAVNRGGTANALTFASRCYSDGRLTRFLHLSTALVAGAGSAGMAKEDELRPAPVHTNHYEWSKYEAERIVRAAMHAGLPATICRPGMVVGDRQTGRTTDFNVIYPLVRLMAGGHITRFPAEARARIHLAPIDFVVDAVARALDEPWTSGLTFHLTSADPPTVADLLACEAFFPPNSPRPVLCAPGEFDSTRCAPRERELLESLAFCFPYFNSRLSFDTANAGRLLPLPVTDAAFLERLGRYAIASGYLRHEPVTAEARATCDTC